MRSIPAIAIAVLLLAGCASVKYADGERVALEHDPGKEWDEFVQKEADATCIKSGGRAPATRISSMPVHGFGPAMMVKHVSTFRCS